MSTKLFFKFDWHCQIVTICYKLLIVKQSLNRNALQAHDTQDISKMYPNIQDIFDIFKYIQDLSKISTKYQAATGPAQAQGRAGPGPARARPWARAGPAAAWYFVLILYILDMP